MTAVFAFVEMEFSSHQFVMCHVCLLHISLHSSHELKRIRLPVAHTRKKVHFV